ncbi:MAG: hypothetical protein ACPHIA_02685 [Alphaproteobacteria bacterium]
MSAMQWVVRKISGGALFAMTVLGVGVAATPAATADKDSGGDAATEDAAVENLAQNTWCCAVTGVRG